MNLLLYVAVYYCVANRRGGGLGVMFVKGDVARNTLLRGPERRTPPIGTTLCLHERPSIKAIHCSGRKMDKDAAFSFLPRASLLFPGIIQITSRFGSRA